KRRGQQEEVWGIQPRIIWRVAAEQLLLSGMMRGGIVSAGRLAFECQRAGCIEAGEISADGFVITVNQTVRQGDPCDDAQCGNDQQNQAIAACAGMREPGPGPEGLPSLRHVDRTRWATVLAQIS